MKKILPTIITSIIVLTLIVLTLLFTETILTENQKDTLRILFIICGCSVIYCFTVGQITNNYSQMDKLWSLLPIAYVWVVAICGGLKLRLLLYALIVTAWGIRLTINFARKGAYSIRFWTGVEDYRWSIVHDFTIFKKRFLWALFNFFFISLYQNALVLAICLPSLAMMESTAPFGVWDVIAIVLSISFLILETVSDEYQWRFYQKKKQLMGEYGSLDKLPKPYDLGFNVSGPWGYMRHPNYLGEQGIWLSLYIFAIGAGITSHCIFHWSLIGPLLLVFLFMGSSSLGESISSKKYPRYVEYIDTVFKYLPFRRFKEDEQ